MTDNRTTELRAKLTERGIEYTTNDHMGVYETSWNGFTAMQLTPSAKLIMAVTPEQAIAATLGSGTCEERGTLTADDVRDLIERHSAWVIGNNRCFHNGAYEEIADELNAKLGSGTCEMVASGTACKGNTDKRCTACGAYGIGEHYDGDEHIATPKFCPECGKKVER